MIWPLSIYGVTVILAVLRLTGVLRMSWWWVTTPLWVTGIAVVLMVLVLAFILLVSTIQSAL